MKYPHRLVSVSPGSALAACACGVTARLDVSEVLDGGVEDGDDCPVALRQHVADLSGLQASIHKAVAAERAAVVRWLRGDPWFAIAKSATRVTAADVADAIADGRHHDGPATGERDKP